MNIKNKYNSGPYPNEFNFKMWVKKHDPKMKWDWENPEKLRNQLCYIIGKTGYIQLKDIFNFMANANYAQYKWKTSSGLTPEQEEKFEKGKY